MSTTWWLGISLVLMGGCASSLLRVPAEGPEAPAAAYEVVPDEPPPPHVELVRAPPSGNAVWVDGQWERVDGSWRWTRGGWATPPVGAKFTPARLRRDKDGSLHFAAARWVDASGRSLEVTPARGGSP